MSSVTQTRCTWPVLNKPPRPPASIPYALISCSPTPHFLLSEGDTYRLDTEMIQEYTGLFLSGLMIILVEKLVEDPLNHGVGGNAFQS